MIVEYKTIELFGKMLFEKVILIPPFRKKNPMSDEACFLYVMEGEYNSISEKEQLRIQADESVLMKCGNYLSHMYPSGNSKRYEAVAVHFYPEILKKIYDSEMPNFLKRQDKNPKALGMGRINSDLLISKYIEGILFYFENPSLVNEEILILKLKEIILLLDQTKNAPAIHIVLSNLFNPTTFSFREIVDAHLYSVVSLPELSELASMSVSTFKRKFTEVYDTSPAAYIKDKKLEKAKELLLVSEVPMSNVAFDSGFNDVAHFSRSFKKKFGVSPSSFRLNQTNKSLS